MISKLLDNIAVLSFMIFQAAECAPMFTVATWGWLITTGDAVLCVTIVLSQLVKFGTRWALPE